MKCKCGQELRRWNSSHDRNQARLFDIFESESGWIYASSEAEARLYVNGFKGYIYPHDVKVFGAIPRTRRLGLCRIGVWLRALRRRKG